MTARDILIPPLGLPGVLRLPKASRAIVVFAHGSGSSRLSPRNTYVAAALNKAGFATLLFDLLLANEEADRKNVFDISLLAARLVTVVRWTSARSDLTGMSFGLFGASTGAAAALVAAAELGDAVGAVVSRGGRPDLAGEALEAVRAPTLLIVGEDDREVLSLNEQAFVRLNCQKALKIVSGATHLFPEPGALDSVIAEATAWFTTHLTESNARS
ncbi:alpha/beta family hydrolase [Rhizobium sp. YS-1r]|uniref:dienelactone hydrolase family protein n=1 Tax=Rhizobium sp. YS-1r TaxID=1532558 RepID=UPI00050F0BE8|nr:alpha/beta family hydrolase [Rhizobium sp. YS-1r]KGD99976.1 DeoR faimly transcriptional regulator [Rhizobium sp. YS-1r]